eukprot:CAMPEP_0184529304 /NCGR_PEP_ID=MMETSP0198_2-20121128/12297_1 /TAXON_ID=1112570 /ORGANISM="Thraustochytrium sp., Strain LLF1b" /LENGTH=400 /DNA_ID=CAMNT_0026921295 /DNA_START=87 /DNA_END=1289 /DNA_ORIENTATION=+
MYLSNKPHKQKRAAFFSVDDELIYWPFFEGYDFGPLHIGQLYRFCEIMRSLLDDPKLQNKVLYFYSSTHPTKKANAAFLIASFMMMEFQRTAEEAYQPFMDMFPPLTPFHDATPMRCTYNLTVLDCLRGLHRAVQLNHINFDTFDIDEFEHMERVENGDATLITPKFIAFAGPKDFRSDVGDGYSNNVPEDYLSYFRKNNVKLVIRLNKKCYDEQRFVRAGIKHVDLFYPDGHNPPAALLRTFLQICEAEPGAIAVHCKAGLGRTGTCIGAYLMKHFGYTCAEVIGLMRVCRPGSVIGPQQHYLEDIEAVMHHEGAKMRSRNSMSNNLVHSFNSFSPPETILDLARSSAQQREIETETKDDEAPSHLTQGDILNSRKKRLSGSPSSLIRRRSNLKNTQAK